MKHRLRFVIITLVAFSVIFPSIVSADVDSPRKQMANGIAAEDVVCKKELHLMVKGNGNSICVKFSSITRLVDFGVAKVIDTPMREIVVDEGKDAEIIEDDTTEKTLDSDTNVFNSTEKIIINSEESFYKPGSVIVFTGIANPNQELEISIEDPNEDEVFSDILEIDGTGKVYFEIATDISFVEGTYFLIATQLDDSEIIPVILGDDSGDIVAVFEKFNYELNSQATLEIFGPSFSKISMTVLNSHNQKQFEDEIEFGPQGHVEYLLDLSEYGIGVYTVVFSHGTEEITEKFTVGLRTGTAQIETFLAGDSYKPGDSLLLYGTSSRNTLLLLEVIDPLGKVTKKIQHHTDINGEFSYKFEIPANAKHGIWKIAVSNSVQMSEVGFDVGDGTKSLTLELDKDTPYSQGDLVRISGYGFSSLTEIPIQIKSGSSIIDKLSIFPTNDYRISVIWQVPYELNDGVYTVQINDGTYQAIINLIVE